MKNGSQAETNSSESTNSDAPSNGTSPGEVTKNDPLVRSNPKSNRPLTDDPFDWGDDFDANTPAPATAEIAKVSVVTPAPMPEVTTAPVVSRATVNFQSFTETADKTVETLKQQVAFSKTSG